MVEGATMINTLSKTLEAQERIQDIKESPSTKIGTKPDTRLQKNELQRGDRTRPYEDQMHPISCSATAGVSSNDRKLSEAVIGRTDFTVHRRGNNSVRTGCSSYGQPDVPASGVRSSLERFQNDETSTVRVIW